VAVARIGRRWLFSLVDLSVYLRQSHHATNAIASELGLLTWNRKRTRHNLLTDMQAKAVIARARCGKRGLSKGYRP